MSDSRTPGDPDHASGDPQRAPYEPPSLTVYGTLEDLTGGAFGDPGDEAMTGSQP